MKPLFLSRRQCFARSTSLVLLLFLALVIAERTHVVAILLALIVQALVVAWVPVPAAWLLLPLVGFALVFWATLHKVFRTGEFLKWRLGAQPNDRTERLLYAYGLPLFISGILFPLLMRRLG